MKSINSFLILLICSHVLLGQNKESLSKALSYVSTGNSFSSLGNFASISTTEGTLKGSLFFLNKKESSMYTLDFSAGATEGISVLFDEGKLNTKVTIGGEYRKILKNISPLVGTSYNKLKALEYQEQKAKKEFDNELFKLIKLYKSGQTDFSKDDTLNKKLTTIDSILKIYKDMSIEEEQGMSKFQKLIKERTELLRAKVNNELEQKINNDFFNAAYTKLSIEHEEKISEIKKKKDDIKPEALRFSFLSLGYSASREDFKLLVDSLDLDKQLSSEDYTSHKIRVAYNFISNVDPENKQITNREFFSSGVEFNYSHNLSSLTKLEVVDTQVIDSVSGRTTLKKQNAFEGEYRRDIRSLNFFIDYYYFLTKEPSSIAIHLSPKALVSDFQRPVTSIMLGFLIPFKKKDNPESSVNLEVFYRIKDVFNTTDNENSILNRNQIGFQASFPFNF